MVALFFYLLALIFSSLGLFFILINLNRFVIGYSFWQYIKFIFTNIECGVFFIGIIILILIYERG